MNAPDFIGYVLGVGQLAVLLGIFYKQGRIGALLEEHEHRLNRLERAKV